MSDLKTIKQILLNQIEYFEELDNKMNELKTLHIEKLKIEINNINNINELINEKNIINNENIIKIINNEINDTYIECKTCNISLFSKNYDRHILTKSHINKANKNNLKTCELCNLTVQIKHFKNHLNTKTHINNNIIKNYNNKINKLP